MHEAPAPSIRVSVSQAFRQAGRLDRTRISPRAGVVAAIPVAAMLALGTAVGSPAAAVTMGVGAMLTGVAWRAGDGPLVPPIGTMAGAVAALAAATLAGTLSGRWPWLHLVVLVIVCLIAGIAAALGRRGLVVGTQSVIAFIVFGRFPENAPHALILTGFVLAGGTAQTLFAAIVAVPLAWHRQRDALASAYRAIADFTGQLTTPSLPAAAALDTADQLLAAPALFADPDRNVLADLVGEGRRIRLELIAFSVLQAQLSRTRPTPAETSSNTVRNALARLRELLAMIVAAIEGETAALAGLPAQAAQLSEWGAARARLPSAALDRRLAALIGQVTAAARLAAALRAPGTSAIAIRVGRPVLGTRPLGSGIAEDLRKMQVHATRHTAAGRHALRLAVVVPLTELLAQRLALPRGYWAVVAASTVLRPSFGATFTRGAERMVGTCAGVVIASVIAVVLDPGGWAVVAVVAVLACCTYAVFPASFTAGVAMLTGVIVFLLHIVAPDSAQTALDRGIDTVIGGAIGLVAYALWPTWSARSTGPLLANLVDAQNAYLEAVLSGLTGGLWNSDAELRPLARQARIAYADADSAIALARSEPPLGGADVRSAATVLNALRRVVQGVHTLRLDAETTAGAQPPVPLLQLTGFGDALSVLGSALRGAEHPPLPPLHARYRDLAHRHPELLGLPLWATLDELVDAINSAAAAVGLPVG
jgi:uncharacterized membrane protein YccC